MIIPENQRIQITEESRGTGRREHSTIIDYKGRLQKNKTAYLVKRCKKVGGGLVQIIFSNVCEKMTNYKGGGGTPGCCYYLIS